MAQYPHTKAGTLTGSRSHPWGFTLLEIVVSMLILSLVVSGVFALFVTSHKYINESRCRLQALNYARMVTEHLNVYVSAGNLPPAPPNAGTGPGGALEAGDHDLSEINLASPLNLDGTNYHCNYAVASNIDGTDLEQVTVTVTWTEP